MSFNLRPIGQGLCLLALVTSHLSLLAQDVGAGCGSLKNAFGPYDYRRDRYVPEGTYHSHAMLLKTVEDVHFTIETQMLRRRANSPGMSPGGDLDYTLRAFPNHHHALITLIALGELEKTGKPAGSRYSIDCWFQRAVAWRPDDNIARMIYAQYLAKAGQLPAAEQQLNIASSQAGDSAFTLNNLGLIYFDIKKYDQALAQAHKAYALGFTNMNLRDRLKSVGKWVDAEFAVSVVPAETAQ